MTRPAAAASTRAPARTAFALVWPARLGVESFAAKAGVHPDLVRRFLALGLLEATHDASGELWLAPAQLTTVARIQRLRAGLCLNYASIGLVLDLLDRIADLEAALRRGGLSVPTSR